MPDSLSSPYRIVGTAGHIDHGKSALVLALTGTDPDRLQEEKKRGITIELGFADLQLGDLHVGFIDVPGHERFVKNMLAGIGGIDAVLMVVAADESIMPQTREHFAICRLLGIRHGVVALTKCELVVEELLELVELETREFLAGSALADAPIIRTSVVSGDGLDDLRAALATCLRATPERPAEGVLRLPVDRAFTVKGFGSVVTGTLLSGTVRVGERVQVQPSDTVVTVRGIQVHGSDTEAARAGQRTALNLQGIQVDKLARGTVISRPGALAPSYLIDARLEVLEGFTAIEHHQRIRFHHGAAEILGRMSILQGDRIPGGDNGLVQLRLESPYTTAPGDRFIVRRYSPVVTIGGGVVIDPAPSKHRRRSQAAQELRRLERGTDVERLVAWVRQAGFAGLDRRQLQLRFVRPPEVIDGLIREGRDIGALVLVAGSVPRAIAAPLVEALERDLLAQLASYHERYPLRVAATKEELRSSISGSPPVEVLGAALERLVAADHVRGEDTGYALSAHRIRLPRSAEQTEQALMQTYERAGLTPPGLAKALETCGENGEEAREVLHYLLRQGRLVRIKEDIVLHAEVLERFVDALRSRFPRGQQFSVAEFKDWAGVTRKHAIPLLEHLDSLHITRRVGDARERM